MATGTLLRWIRYYLPLRIVTHLLLFISNLMSQRRIGMVRVCQVSRCQPSLDPVGVPVFATATALSSRIQIHGCHPRLDGLRFTVHSYPAWMPNGGELNGVFGRQLGLGISPLRSWPGRGKFVTYHGMKSRSYGRSVFRPSPSSVTSPVAQAGDDQNTGVKRRPTYLRCQITSTLVCSSKMRASAPRFMEIGRYPPQDG